MNLWRQTKRYQCPACGAVYLHDQAYVHAAFKCVYRARSAGKGTYPGTGRNSLQAGKSI
ncbi:MAG: hypothetical protein Nkreftii_002697 [Candidatus Nitrospira kreftii]|uniref:Uncharacterized protein n=1 Tax=Candidatus Nitrospira kreftii TaxID=2652173 RepID=A0A7S8J040_9BACT|nr:MAG: hypothetical protein Nkreftii_002697 [Candidatus Nitrospira kreftii]